MVSVVYFAKPCKKWPSGCASSTNGSVPTMTESSECLKKMSAVEGSPRSKEWVRSWPIFKFSAENAEIEDCMVERNKFELSVPLARRRVEMDSPLEAEHVTRA